MSEFTGRSLKKAMADTTRLVEELRIKKAELVGINVDSFGDTRIHMKAPGFVRVVRARRVALQKVRTSLDDNGNLHAEFSSWRTLFVTMVKPNTEEMEALTMGEQPKIEQASERIGQPGQLLLTGPST